MRRGVVVEAHEAVAHFQIVDDDATPPRRLVVVAGHDLRERCRRRERLRLGAEPPLLRRHGDFYAKIVICPKAAPKQGVWVGSVLVEFHNDPALDPGCDSALDLAT